MYIYYLRQVGIQGFFILLCIKVSKWKLMFLDCQQQSVMSTKKANLWRTLIWRPFHLHSTHNVSFIMCFSLLNSPILAITKYGIENQIQLTKNIKW